MGIFGICEILRNLENEQERSVGVKRVTGLMLTRDEARRIVGPVLRGTALGSFLGVLPGGGAMRNGGTEGAAPFTPTSEEAVARYTVSLAVAVDD